MGEPEVRKGASRATDPRVAARELHAAIAAPDAALSIFYCSPRYDLAALGNELSSLFGDSPLIGCTTAGEITPLGYLDGTLTGASIGTSGFETASVRIDNLRSFELADGDRAAKAAMSKLSGSPNSQDTFGFLLADGLSTQEEALVASIYRNLKGAPLFGGSAGDETNFGQTHIYHEGLFRTDCALFTLVRTTFPFTVFKTEHFVSSSEKMVVTEADPARRVVTEINGAPAGREYARMVGLDVDKLTPLIFATHPVVVTVGDSLYVRSIQKVNPDGSLTFFCAIDEGIVLTVGRGVDMVDNLKRAFDAVRREIGPPALVLGCDCLFRSIEAMQSGVRDRISALLIENNVVGFATYGEQFNGMHVNQTFTGAALGSRSRTDPRELSA